jgi:hypothetical protein
MQMVEENVNNKIDSSNAELRADIQSLKSQNQQMSDTLLDIQTPNHQYTEFAEMEIFGGH